MFISSSIHERFVKFYCILCRCLTFTVTLAFLLSYASQSDMYQSFDKPKNSFEVCLYYVPLVLASQHRHGISLWYAIYWRLTGATASKIVCF